MIDLFKVVASLFASIARYFADKQLLDAGEAKQGVAEQAKVEEHVQAAKDAVAIPDAGRTERLRNKYDRSRIGK